MLQAVVSAIALSFSVHQSSAQNPPVSNEQPRIADDANVASKFSTESPSESQVHLLVNHSLFVETAQKLARIYITDPKVLSTYTVSPNQILITAKAPGESSLVVWDQSGHSQSYVVSSDVDIEKLKSSILKSLPDQDIKVESDGGRVMLSGFVGTPAAADAADKLASLYSKDILNALIVNSSRLHQVKLKVRVLEVDRAKMTQLGVNIFSTAGNTLGQTSTLQFPSQITASKSGSTGGGVQTNVGGKAVSVLNPLNLTVYNSSINVGATLQDLEDKQILQILAEPTLTTLNGEKASFLSGGEFPFPVVQGASGGLTSVSVQFRPFGVKLDFTPNVNIDGTIELKVVPEVSALDYANAVSINGYNIPALSTRKAETKVVLKDGQSFAISGLLDRRTTDQYSRMPGIASIPILGELFKSRSIDHTRTELVVVVTPEIVDPTSTSAAVEPKFPVQNLNPDTFDATTVTQKDKK